MVKKPNIYGSLLVLISMLVTFIHLLVLLQVIPYTYVWGGRLESVSQMYTFELVALFMTGLLGFCVKIYRFKARDSYTRKILKFLLWMYFCLFLINIFTNLLAISLIEKSLSLLSFGFCFLIFKFMKTEKSLT